MDDKQKELERIEQQLLDELLREEKEPEADKEELAVPVLTEDVPENDQQDLELMKQELLEVLLREENEPEAEKEELVSVLTGDIPEEDKQQELERIDQELLEDLIPEEAETEEATEKETPVPAFEDPDRIVDPKEPLVYCNFSNDYGKELEEALKEEQPEPTPKPAPQRSSAVKAKRDEKIIIGLMLAISILCVGILGVFIYWLETLLKLL